MAKIFSNFDVIEPLRQNIPTTTFNAKKFRCVCSLCVLYTVCIGAIYVASTQIYKCRRIDFTWILVCICLAVFNSSSGGWVVGCVPHLNIHSDK